MIGTDERPGIEEVYLGATVTSDLTLSVHRRGAADVLIAAGMAPGQLGRALAHLRAEWDRCDKPRKRTKAEIAARSMLYKDKKGHPDMRRATAEAIVEHASALRKRAQSLTGRNLVIGLLTEFAAERGIDPDLVSPALFHWLAPQCGACDGRKKMHIPDTPALSEKDCIHCKGTGLWPRPYGAQELHDHMKQCANAVRGAVKANLYAG